MRGLKRWPIVFVMCAAAAGVCAPGCSRRDAPAIPPPTLRVGLGAPVNPTPGTGMANVVAAMTSESWLTAQGDGQLTDRVVTAWSWDEPRTTLHLTLRPNVYFHDGTLLTPAVAVEAIRLSVKERAYSSFATIQSVAPIGADTVEIKLSEPNSFLLPDLSLTPVKLSTNPNVGTGPFQLVRRDDQQAVLKAFPKYYRGPAGLAEIDIMNYPTQRNAWAALMRGDVDMLYDISRDAVEFVKAESTIKTYTFPKPYYNALVFNLRHPILRRVDVRRAINEALDKNALIKEGLNSRGRPADSPLLPEHWAYSTTPQPFVFNPEAVRAKLDAAGLRLRPGAGGSMPSRFSFNCLVFSDDPRFERLTVLVQRQLADVGIEMKLVPMPVKDAGVKLRSGEFDAILFEMAGRSLSWIYEFWHSRDGARLNTGYVAADGVLDRVRTAKSDVEIREGMAEFIRIVHEDPPAVFIAWQTTSRAVSTRFDVAAESNRDIVSSVWKWRRAPAADEGK